MWSFGAFCDEFYVHSRLYLKLDLVPTRESALHFFERLRKAFPKLNRLRRRDDGSLMVDEDDNNRPDRRYVRIDPHALKFGYHNPPNLAAVQQLQGLVLEQAPAHLSLSELDYDYAEVVFGFDLEYRGNHDELVAETLLAEHPLINALTGDGQTVIDCQPFVGVALSDDCETQVYMEIKGRTSTFEIRSNEFEPQALSVYVTVRRYWAGIEERPLAEVYDEMLRIGESFASERVLPHVVKPLADAIASRR